MLPRRIYWCSKGSCVPSSSSLQSCVSIPDDDCSSSLQSQSCVSISDDVGCSSSSLQLKSWVSIPDDDGCESATCSDCSS